VEAEPLALAPIAVALSAGALFVPLVLAVWWPRASAAGIAAGILAGFAATAAVILDLRNPGLLPREPVDLSALGLSDLSAAVVGLPVALLVTIGVSLVTAPSRGALAGRLGRMRRPPGPPVAGGA
jgi:Na+(H+)/acetate symporter ActP